jgi:hypothetical protein
LRGTAYADDPFFSALAILRSADLLRAALTSVLWGGSLLLFAPFIFDLDAVESNARAISAKGCDDAAAEGPRLASSIAGSPRLAL